MDYHAGDKWFIHGPKRHKENHLLSLEHPCWLSLVYHVNMGSMATCSVRYSKGKVRGQKILGHPFPHQQTHHYMLRPISRNQIHSYIYTLVQISLSVQAKLEVVRRKHTVRPSGFGAYSSTCCKGTNSYAGTMGIGQLPFSTVGL